MFTDVNIFSAGSLSFQLNVMDFQPGGHTLIITVTDARGLSDSVSILFTTPPRLMITCSVTNNFLTCDSTNRITSQSCSFDGRPHFVCFSSFSISEIGLDPGPHSVTISVNDEFGQSTDVQVDFSVAGGVRIVCQELVNGVDCQSTGENGTVIFTCSYDGKPAEECKCHLILF